MFRNRSVRIVSFSGVDGAGKTTQISGLETWLKQASQRTALLTFWDNIVAFPRLREFLSLKAFRGDQGVGSPEKPVVRCDKNVTSMPVIATRFVLYFADAMSLRWKIRKLRKSNLDVIIFDRYVYDELANLPLHWWASRIFVRFIAWLAPKPDVAYVLDADPQAAFARKPEYPLEFLRRNREAYLALSQLIGDITVIDPLPVEAATQRIREGFLMRIPHSEAEFSHVPVLQ